MIGSHSAEAVFGSFTRGDSDEFSDRDILIVSDDLLHLKDRRIQLEAVGWSVASYTWSKLEALSRARALFIQHLKLESSVLRDDNGRLTDILSRFEPKHSYSLEIEKNLDLIGLVRRYPDGSRGSQWGADVIYVCLRNYGVLKLAELGKYVFSFHAILDELSNASIIDSRSADKLRRLRWMKSLYRNGETLPAITAQKVLKSVLDALPGDLQIDAAPCSPWSIIESAQPMDSNAPAYQRLRNLEKIYISFSEVSGSVCLLPEFIKLKSWIEDPRSYACFAKANECDLLVQAKIAARELGRLCRAG